MFLSRDNWRIVDPQKFDVLNSNKYFSKQRSFEGLYASFLNIKFPRDIAFLHQVG